MHALWIRSSGSREVINTTDTIKYECDSIEDGIVIVNSLHNIRYEGMDWPIWTQEEWFKRGFLMLSQNTWSYVYSSPLQLNSPRSLRQSLACFICQYQARNQPMKVLFVPRGGMTHCQHKSLTHALLNVLKPKWIMQETEVFQRWDCNRFNHV